jgi:hypothetical protein
MKLVRFASRLRRANSHNKAGLANAAGENVGIEVIINPTPLTKEMGF